MDSMRNLVKRQMMVRGYTQQMLMPQVSIRRDELLGVLPPEHQSLLDRGDTRAAADRGALRQVPARAGHLAVGHQGRAGPCKLQAMRHIRAAHEALATRDFQDVAREFSKGVHAGDGGSWGRLASLCEHRTTSPLRRSSNLPRTAHRADPDRGRLVHRSVRHDHAGDKNILHDVQDDDPNRVGKRTLRSTGR